MIATSSPLRSLAGRIALSAAALGIGVHDAWTGRGIGTALLATLLETADDWLGLRRIELMVYADNAHAIALYERFGFAREGLMRCHSFRAGRYVDTLAMARLRGRRIVGCWWQGGRHAAILTPETGPFGDGWFPGTLALVGWAPHTVVRRAAPAAIPRNQQDAGGN